MDGYARAGHCKYDLKVHLIFVTKYRKRILIGRVTRDLKAAITHVSAECGCKVIQMEADKDHVHILLAYSPSMSISDIVKSLKQYSAAVLWRLHAGLLRKHYWRGRPLWSDGYFACSIGQASQAVIERYIRSQG